MLKYTLRRLAWLPVILVGVSLLTFGLLRGLPGQDPADAITGTGATPEQKERIRKDLGLERPVFPIDVDLTEPSIGFDRDNQYTDWLEDMLTGKFGYTFESKEPIREEFVERFPETIEILILSLTFSAVFGVSFGILSAMFRNGVIDYIVRVFAVLGSSIPEFFLLSLLVILPSYWWNYSMPV